MFKRRLIAADQASVFMAMTSDHNRSELGIQDHSNEPSSSKLVPKVVPLAVKTATSRQALELLFHLHIAMLRTTGPSDACTNLFPPFQDSPRQKLVHLSRRYTRIYLHHLTSEIVDIESVHKLLSESLRNIIVIFCQNIQSDTILVFTMTNGNPFQCPTSTAQKSAVKRCMSMLVKNKRSQDGKDDKDNDKGSKSRSQSMKEQAYNEDKDQEHSSLNDKSNLTDLMKECHQ
ncbi:hypothetical protein Tco_1381937 [Tanacetum coccineum]